MGLYGPTLDATDENTRFYERTAKNSVLNFRTEPATML